MDFDSEPNLITSESVEKWIEALDNFKNIIYPRIFKDFGFTFQEAYVIWLMNTTKNAIYDLEEVIKGEDTQEF